MVVWAAGAALTGRFAHGLSETDLRRRRPARFAANLAGLGVVLVAVYYLAVVVPRAVLVGLLVPGLLVGVALGAVPFGVQTAGALLSRRRG